MDLKERIDKAIKSGNRIEQWCKKPESSEFREFNALSFILTKTYLTGGCGNCARDFLIYLKHVNKTKIENTMKNQEKKFTIHENKQIHVFGSPDVYTKHNIDDEKAIALLKQSKKHISQFESYPENWEELVDGSEPKKETSKVKKEVSGDQKDSGEIVHIPSGKGKSKNKK